jgi:N-acetylmuramoyl-L-alanine amidase
MPSTSQPRSATRSPPSRPGIRPTSLPNGIIIESKGRFLTADRQKHLLIKQQHPQLDIRFVFQRSANPIARGRRPPTPRGAEARLQFADKRIPEEFVAARVKPSDVKYLVVHCSATPPKADIGVLEIDRMHRERGFLRIGYHFVIRRSGQVQTGREVSAVGAHVAGYNDKSLGICMVGGVSAKGKAENNFTPEQFVALRSLLAGLKQGEYAQAEVLGHRDLSPDKNHDGRISPNEWLKDCPCFDVRAWWAGSTKE